MLTLCLCVSIIGIAFLGALWLADNDRIGQRFRFLQGNPPTARAAAITTLVVTLISAATLYAYTMGPGRPDSSKMRQMRHLGYAFFGTGPRSAGPVSIRLQGFQPTAPTEKNPIDLAPVVLDQLGDRGVVRLSPIQSAGPISSWGVQCSVTRIPVRVDGLICNPIAGGWLKAEETYDFRLSRSLTVGFRFESRGSGVEVSLRNGSKGWLVLPYRGNRTITLTRQLALADLLEAQAVDGEGSEELRAIMRRLDQPLTSRGEKETTGIDLLRDVYLVREKRLRADSRIGLLVDRLLGSGGRQVLRNGENQSVAGDMTDQTVTPKDRNLLIGEDSRLNFRLPESRSELFEGVPHHLRLEFVNPRAYPLPPTSPKTVDYLISTVGSDLPLDGYYFATGNVDHPVYAKLRITASHGSAELLDNVKKDEKGILRGQELAVGQPFVIHDRMLGVVAELRDSAAGLRPPAWATLGLFLLSGLWMSLVLWRNFGTVNALEFALGTLWIAATALILVRLVISFRTACLPPLDASAADFKRFRDTWLFANLALLVPFAMTAATLLSIRKTSDGRVTTGSFYGAREAASKRAGLRQVVDNMTAVAMANIRDNCISAMGWLAAICLALAIGQTALRRFDFTSVQALHLGVIVALLICLYHLFYVATGEPWASRFSGLLRYWLPLGLCIALVLASLFLGQIASVRTSIAAFVIVIVCLLGLALRLAETERAPNRSENSGDQTKAAVNPVNERKTLLGLFTLCLALVLLSVFLIDMGSFLYSVPLLFGLGLVWKPATGTNRPFIAATGFLLIFFIVGAWLFPPQTFAGRGIAGGDRWAVQMGRAPEAMKATSRDDSSATADSVIRIEQQRWQMLAYAGAMGTPRPPGYGGTHLTEGGMQYRTMLSDSVFSVFILGEHGVVVGALICILYALMFLGCLAAGWRIGKDRRWIFVAVVAIGGFYFTHGVYMALANLWAVPFTGQNMPLLSIASFWDVLQSAALLPLACYLLYANLGPSWAVAGDFSGKFSRTGFVWLPSGLMAAVLGYFVIQANRIGAGDMSSYRISPAAIEYLQSQIDAGYLTVDRDLAIHADTRERPMSAIEWLALDQYRKGRNEPDKDLLYAAAGRDPEHPELRVNPNAFSLVSPLYSFEGVAWRGSIEPVSGERLPRMVHLSRPRVMVFDSGQRPKFVDVGDDSPGLTRGRGMQARVIDGGPATRLAPFHRRLDGRIVVSAGLKNPGYAVYHNGVQLGVQKGSEQPLSPNDVIVVENTKSQARYHFLYLGPSAGSVAEVRWQNGKYRRIFEPGSSFVLARSLGALGDASVQAMIEKGATPGEIEEARQKPLRLSLDWRLHQQTQAELAAFCRRSGVYRISDPRSAEVAVTLMDSFTGEILAMPSGPQVAPADLPETLGGVGPIQRQVVTSSNWNLRNHIIGSTVKPLTFAALANGLHKAPVGGGLDLAEIKVIERDASHSRFGDYTITTKIQKDGRIVESPLVCGPAGTHTMDSYLVRSLTWVAVVTGSMGLVQDKGNIGQILKKTNANPDITYKGVGYRVDLDADPTYFGAGSSRGEVMGNIYTSVLFQSLHKLYGTVIESEEQGRWSAKNRTDLMGTFIPSFTNAANSYAASQSVPAPILFDGAEFRDFRNDLISFMIGGGNNQWNNVQLASAFSSLATGRQVVPTLEARDAKKPAPAAFDASFAPLNSLAWREAHLYKPMERSRLEGTARKMTTPLSGYRALFKTGTIGAAGGKTEDETLVFVVGKYVPGTGFVKGQTVTGYLYLSQSKTTTRRNSGIRFQLANPIIKRVVEYLKSKTS